MKLYTSLFFSVLSLFSIAQECHTLDESSTHNVSINIAYLASDEMEGRLPGTKGAEMAAQYIETKFKESNLIPFGVDGSFFQYFDISDWVAVKKKNTKLTLNEGPLELNKDFYAMPQSSNGIFEGELVSVGFGIEATDLGYNDYKKLKPAKLEGKIFIIDVSSPDGIHPHSAYLAYHNLDSRVEVAKSKGAKGVIFVNQGEMASDPNIKFRKIKNSGVPVVFLKTIPEGGKLKKLKTASIQVHMDEQTIQGINVAGLLDKGAETTIIIGAHYDHLGWGEENSLYKGEPQIHNGADDNASGTAGLLELVKYFSQDTTYFASNILFVSFSGEERGLLGSNYFAKNLKLPRESINYMLNMDMIGRLDDNQLAISGVGTSELWESIIDQQKCDLLVKTSLSGVGPSDHTSFYNIEIPALHFFTGTHNDYHKPTDDFEAINTEGVVTVLNMMIAVIESVGDEKLAFTPTVNEDARKASKFSVTLGIVPDYMYEDGGVKIDGINEGKPAIKAGLQVGDIVIQLGKVKVTDMYSYMDALSLYKKGDTVTVVFIRGGEEKEAELTF